MAARFVKTTKAHVIKAWEVFGSDLTVVNTARISHGVNHSELNYQDIKLLDYLARNKHFSPFKQPQIRMRIRMSEHVGRQFFRHLVGIEHTSEYPTKDLPWNEISGRYKKMNELYVPEVWYEQHTTQKQGSGKVHKEQECISELFNRTVDTTMGTYEFLVQMGVAREQARLLLPLTFMTDVWTTMSLMAVSHFIGLRNHCHAQKKIRVLAQELEELVVDAFPFSYRALAKYQ